MRKAIDEELTAIVVDIEAKEKELQDHVDNLKDQIGIYFAQLRARINGEDTSIPRSDLDPNVRSADVVNG